MNQFEIIAEPRPGNGSSAARRLRLQGKVPAVIYGGNAAPESVAVQLKDLTKQLENEAFFSHILTAVVDGKPQQVVLKALQRHPINARVIHMDLLRVSQSQALHMHVPLHFVNEDTSPGKKAGGVANHHMIELEISCLPKDLPEFIEVDVGGMTLGDTLHLREVILPAGVTMVTHGLDLMDAPVVSIQHAQKLDVEPSEGEATPGTEGGAAWLPALRAAPEQAVMARLRLIVGLGNPGARYEGTRHNAGFEFIDALARREGVTLAASRQYNGHVGEMGVGADRVWLLRPATFMNLSGQAVAPLAGFYRIAPDEILVAHDELDLAPGTVRLKKGGGHGGHNGLRDIVARLGSSDFLRLRIGIGHPGHKDLVLGYVLQRAPQAERQATSDAIARVEPLMQRVMEGDLQGAMNELHRRESAA